MTSFTCLLTSPRWIWYSLVLAGDSLLSVETEKDGADTLMVQESWWRVDDCDDNPGSHKWQKGWLQKEVELKWENKNKR